MSGHLAEVPLWAAIVAALLALLGSVLTLLGTIGPIAILAGEESRCRPTASRLSAFVRQPQRGATMVAKRRRSRLSAAVP